MIASNPLQTDRMSISAAVPMAMPAALIAEITLMTLCDFRANRYLAAMKSPVSNRELSLFFQKLLDVLGIVQGRIEVEVELGYYPELRGHLAAEFSAYAFLALLEKP